MSDRIIFENVSKFYGEVLGVNRVSLNIPAGITTLVGPNGSGKTTLMNLMTGYWDGSLCSMVCCCMESASPMRIG